MLPLKPRRIRIAEGSVVFNSPGFSPKVGFRSELRALSAGPGLMPRRDAGPTNAQELLFWFGRKARSH
jgi:hypothetical protein